MQYNNFIDHNNITFEHSLQYFLILFIDNLMLFVIIHNLKRPYYLLLQFFGVQ